MDIKKHYTLFYPSQELGGAELLLSRLADKLVERGNKVTIIDSEKEIISKNSNNANLSKLTIKNDRPIFIDSDYLIAFASHISSLRQYVSSNEECKVVFWSIHPLNAIYLMPRIGEKLFQINFNFFKKINSIFFSAEVNVRKRLLESLAAEAAFISMDSENTQMIEKYYEIKYDVSFVPVPVDVPVEVSLERKEICNEVISVAWYGRLCDFKVHALIYLISELVKIKSKFDFILIIIGDGSFRYLVEQAVLSAKISADFKGSMPNREAKAYINRNADVVFAMGTAALEAAAMGIPTILADASYSRIDFPYKFNWLYQTRNFTLGRFVNKSMSIQGHSITEIFQEIHDNQYVHVNASYEYVKNNHEINHVTSLIENACTQSRMSLKRFLNLSDYQKPIIIRLAKRFRNFLSSI